jgi:hypothetical protein
VSLPEKPAAFIHVSLGAPAYFLVEPPPMRRFGEVQPGPLELTPEEVGWVNEVLGLICEEVAPGGWVRSDKVAQIAGILESVLEFHIRDDRLREDFPRVGWRRGSTPSQMNHELTPRNAPRLSDLFTDENT